MFACVASAVVLQMPLSASAAARKSSSFANIDVRQDCCFARKAVWQILLFCMFGKWFCPSTQFEASWISLPGLLPNHALEFRGVSPQTMNVGELLCSQPRLRLSTPFSAVPWIRGFDLLLIRRFVLLAIEVEPAAGGVIACASAALPRVVATASLPDTVLPDAVSDGGPIFSSAVLLGILSLGPFRVKWVGSVYAGAVPVVCPSSSAAIGLWFIVGLVLQTGSPDEHLMLI